ncbi:MAG: hypothetical protein AB7S93_03535 [Xanthobacteraceae bacterium]
MPLSSSFTDEGGGFASFLHQVQKSYVPERDIDGRKFDKAMSRLRARLEETTTARADLAGDLDLRCRADEDNVAAVLTGITAIRFLSLRALQAVEYRRQSLWNFSHIVSTLYELDTWSRRMFDAVDSRIADTATDGGVVASYFQSFGDGTRTFPLAIEGHCRYVMARQLSRISNEIDLKEIRRFGDHFQRVAPALVSTAADAGMRAAMQKYVTAFQLCRSPVGMNFLELGVAAEEMKLWLERHREQFTPQGIARIEQFLDRHDAMLQGSRTWQRLQALAARPEATFERSAQLIVLCKPIYNEIRNLGSIQFSANIDMYLGFRLRAAERLVQAFPHGPANLPALVTVLHDFAFAIRDILLFMGKTVVQSLQESPDAPPADGEPSKGAVAATVTFFRLIEDAARELATRAPEHFGWLDQLYAELDDLPAEVSGELLAFTPRAR